MLHISLLCRICAFPGMRFSFRIRYNFSAFCLVENIKFWYTIPRLDIFNHAKSREIISDSAGKRIPYAA